MMLYKLTDKDATTYGGCQWGEGVTHTAPGTGLLCSEGWLHAYTHPLLAVLLNPIHGRFDPESMRLWECEGEVGATDHGLKVGCARLTTLREIPLPHVTTEQRVRFAVLAAKEVYDAPGWTAWADAWLSGMDRSVKAARAARAAAEAAQAAQAARAARAAARAAAEAAAEAAQAAQAAAWAAQAAAWAAAQAAQAAAWAAAEAVADIDLIALAREACNADS